MNGRRETGLKLSVSEMLNVVFFEKWGYPSLFECIGEGACKERCVSAGKSLGEIACRRCEAIGSREHVVGWLERRSLDTSVSMRGQKEMRGVLSVDVVGLSSCVCGAENWLLIDSFVCEESGKVIGC